MKYSKQAFVRSFREINIRYSRMYALLLTRYGLNLQQYALLNLLMHAGAMPMTRASKLLEITKPAVTNIVDQLEERRYLERKSHPRDRRSHLLELLPKGRVLMQHIQDVVFIPLFKTLDHCTAAEHKAVHQFYENLAGSITEHLEKMMNAKKRRKP